MNEMLNRRERRGGKVEPLQLERVPSPNREDIIFSRKLFID